jgi:hypothetical protein
MTPILAKVMAIEKRGDRYQAIIQISLKYGGSFNTVAFGEIKPLNGLCLKEECELLSSMGRARSDRHRASKKGMRSLVTRRENLSELELISRV